MNENWDQWFMELAEHMARRSKDPSTKCGAVIAKGKEIVSLGYNGFPAGVDDHPDIYADRQRKYRRVLHAEQNALLYAKRNMSDCTCYVWPMPPCSTCAAMLIQAGITRVVSFRPTPEQRDRWGEGMDEALQMFSERGVAVVWLLNPNKE